MPKGQKPKPALVKQLEGNRSKIARAKLLADPRGNGVPRVPAHLSADERALWSDVVRSLPVGLLTRADEGCLERYAIAWARFREASKKITMSGLLIQSSLGPIRNPLLVVQNVAAKEMHAAGSELGLSPVSRARMAAPGSFEDDPMELLLGMDEDETGAWSTLTTRTRQ